MSVHPIVKWPDAALKLRCRPVAVSDDVTALVADLFDTMYDAQGRGLAAPQIGVDARVFVMDAGWKTGEKMPLACLNPEIEVLDGPEVDGEEGCLSMPGVSVTVPRVEHICLRFSDLQGERQELILTGAEARIAQHEADHLDGRMHFHRIDSASLADVMTEWGART